MSSDNVVPTATAVVVISVPTAAAAAAAAAAVAPNDLYRRGVTHRKRPAAGRKIITIL